MVLPGGLFAAEGGGVGNAASLLRAVADVTGRVNDAARHFAGVDETAHRLIAAGFRDIEVELVPDHVELAPDHFEDFLATIMLVPELEALAPADRAAFIQAVARRMGEPVVDYVRLRITATVR